jgi:hypothetical protein
LHDEKALGGAGFVALSKATSAFQRNHLARSEQVGGALAPLDAGFLLNTERGFCQYEQANQGGDQEIAIE